MDDKDAEIARLKAALEGRQDPVGKPVAPKKKKGPLIWWVLGGLTLIMVIGNLASGDDPAPASTAASSGTAAPAATIAPSGDWAYSSDKDPMRDAVTHVACSTSSNQVQLEFPYSDTTADLCIRQAPRSGTDVYFRLNNDGQIVCGISDGCTVKVRFGDGAVQSFTALEAADHSSDIIFISNATRFIAAVKAAPVTRMEVQFYQAGTQALEFPTKDLKWPPAS